MITKAHIWSFSLLVFLYFAVGIWKYLPQGDLQKNNLSNEQNIDIKVSKEFWNHYQKATASRTSGDYEQAIYHYKEALKRNNKHKDALYYLGNMYLFQREFKEAEKYWLRLEELQPNTPRTQLQLGTLYFCMDNSNPLFNLEAAKKRYSYANDLNREETGAPLQLSKIAILNNNISQAKKLLDAILSADNKNYQALFLRGYIDWKRNNRQVAQKRLMRAWRIYQSLHHTELQGEGTTKKGAKAMLSEDLFCDSFRRSIERLMIQSINEIDFKPFDKKISAIKNKKFE